MTGEQSLGNAAKSGHKPTAKKGCLSMTINTQQVYTLQLNKHELTIIAQALSEKTRNIDKMLGGENFEFYNYIEKAFAEHKALLEEIGKFLK